MTGGGGNTESDLLMNYQFSTKDPLIPTKAVMTPEALAKLANEYVV